MSSFGLKGESSRCAPFWQFFSDCVHESPDPTSVCKEARDDYIECLHHAKHFARLNAMAQVYRRKKAAGTLPKDFHDEEE